jgi:hypothetical protein
MKRGLALALLLALAPAARAQGPELDSPAVRAGLDAIRPAALESHLRFLADDLLEGRGTGTRGYDLAARYVASRFQALGLEPGGVNETWFQPLPFRRADVLRGRCELTLLRRGAATQLVLGRDYLMSADTYRTESEVTGDLLYAGYGITAPSRNTTISRARRQGQDRGGAGGRPALLDAARLFERPREGCQPRGARGDRRAHDPLARRTAARPWDRVEHGSGCRRFAGWTNTASPTESAAISARPR